MADTPDVMKHLRANPPQVPQAVTYSYLTPNMKGLTDFIAHSTSLACASSTVPQQAHDSEIAIFGSASEAFSQRNINCSIAESLERFRPVAKKALDQGIKVRGYISMVIACPYDGPTPPKNVAEVVEGLLDMGCYEVSLGDTNGVGTPGTIGALVNYLVKERGIPVEKLAAHFHDTYGQAIANCLVALEAGIRTFDSSIAGLGGCPYSKGATGNVATEDLVYWLVSMQLTSREKQADILVHLPIV
jgi:hydroxymethylglutaryl-CoA lyase